MKKILIIYASAGDGHKKAAEALYNEFKQTKRENLEVKVIDSLDYTNRLFKRLYRGGYIFFVRYIPNFWSFFYTILDYRLFYMLTRPFRRMINAFNTKRLLEFLKEEHFDVVMSTHFLATEVISHLKEKKVLSTYLINLVTDFMPHLFWQSGEIDYYVVATDTTRGALIKRRVPPEKIKVFGIPVDRKFNTSIYSEHARKKLGLRPHKFTVLVMGGGHGVGPIEKIVLELQRVNLDVQIIVVCGYNKRLYDRLNIIRRRFQKPTHIFSFCSNMDEIMAASDIMLSKIGGLTVSEALSQKVPIVAIGPIFGQEARNIDFLCKNEVSLRIRRVRDLRKATFWDKERMTHIRHDMQRFAKPDSASAAAKLAQELIR